MLNSRRRKALYEAINKARFKSSQEKTLERLHPEKAVSDEPVAPPVIRPLPERAAQWPKGPKMVQFNAGRVEISMPYQLAVAAVLVVVLLVLIVFRLGQNVNRPAVNQPVAKVPQAAEQAKVDSGRVYDAVKKVPAVSEKVEPSVKVKGENRIVIKQCRARRDLEPVQEYFTSNGIATEIQERSGGFFLVTRDTYDNPEKAGTDGNNEKKKIIEIGMGYKAPAGYDSFAPRFFGDAYGEKVK